MEKLDVILRIIERLFVMFMVGEKFNDIKSMCLVDYANYLHDKKNIEKALEYYTEALNLNPNNYYACGGLSGAFIEKGLFTEALKFYNNATEIKKPDTLMYMMLVIIQESLGESVLAKEALNKTLKYFDDNLAAAYNQLAYTYSEFDMYEKAEYYCKEAIKLCPNEAGLHNNLAKIYSTKKQYQMAKMNFKKYWNWQMIKDIKDMLRKRLRKLKLMKGNRKIRVRITKEENR